MFIQRKPAFSRNHRRGIVAILVAVSLIVLIGAVALALDAGRLFDRRWQTQSAAEAAAMAAAIDLYNSTLNSSKTAAMARNSALSIAAANGFGNDGKTSIVTVNIPPKSGAYANTSGYVEVIVEYRQTRGFSNVFGSTPNSVVGRSVAGGTTESIPGSVLVLDPKKKKSLFLNKNGSQLVVDGAVVVNSKDKKESISVSKGSGITATDVMLSGGIKKDSRGRIEGTLHTKAPPTPDPLAELPPPEPGPDRKLSDYKTGDDKSGNSYDLPPGTYKDKLEFKKGDVVKMQPGTYYLAGDGFKLKENSTLQANGVLLYGASGKKIEFSTKGSVSLSPPTTGPHAGISIFQNPAKKGEVKFQNGRDYDITGTIYNPNGKVKFKNTDLDLDSGDEEDEEFDDDWSDSDDTTADDPSAGPPTYDYHSSLGAQIISKTMSIDKRSSVHIRGTGLSVIKPLLSIVE